MNKRIKELVVESGNGLMRDGKLYPHMGLRTQEDWAKFAELIVKECCSKLKEMGESWHEFANNPPQGQAHNASGALFAAYRLKEDAVDEIKEHFGVEE